MDHHVAPGPPVRAVRAACLASALALAGTACGTASGHGNARAGHLAPPPGTAAGLPVARTTNWRSAELPAPAGATDASFTGIGCANAASCVAVGDAYYASANSPRAFAVTEVGGSWGKAQTLPVGGQSTVSGVACAPRGPCVAVGKIETDAGPQLFVEAERHGRWSAGQTVRMAASEIPGDLNGVACPRPGDCVTVGDVQGTGNYQVPIVVTESNGTWQDAAEITLPRSTGLHDRGADLSSVACGAPGSCLAVGYYNVVPSGAVARPMAVAESQARWSPAWAVAAPPAAVPAGGAETPDFMGLDSVGCMPDGSCLAVGAHRTMQAWEGGMATTEWNGRWGRTMMELPPLAVATCNGSYCLAITSATTSLSPVIAMTYARGHWGRGARVRPPADADRSPSAGGYGLEIAGVTCFPAGRCIAVGAYIVKPGPDHLPHRHLLVATRP
jgi:hypothetical protein